MATLEARLAALREGAAKRIPEEARHVMHRAAEALAASGAADRALGEGDPAPPFELEAQDGRRVRSADLLGRGPLVVSFFRGHW